jgi:hypothetical protein
VAKAREDRSLQLSYRTVFQKSPGQDVLNSLVIFAQQCTDPVLRAGRSDVVLHILRQMERATEEKNDKEEQPE